MRSLEAWEHFASIDQVLGLRVMALVLYGSLPANLALIGVLDLHTENLASLGQKVVLASVLPITITFILIRARHRDWYLAEDYLNLRSALATTILLAVSTSICGVSVLIHEEFSLGLPRTWTWDEWAGIVQSYLMAVVSLVGSSTLIMALLVKDAKLPGLPSPEFVSALAPIKIKMRDLKKKTREQPSDDEYAALAAQANEIGERLSQLVPLERNRLARKPLEQLRDDAMTFAQVLSDIGASGPDDKNQRWRSDVHAAGNPSISRIITLNLGE